MLRALFYFGVSLSLGAVVLGYDFSRQAAKPSKEPLQMGTYFQEMPQRASALMDKDKDAEVVSARLPQISRGFATPGSGNGSQYIDQFAAYTPMMGALVREGRAEAKKNWWERIRHKASSSDGSTAQNMSKNLAAMRARNSK